MKYLSFLLVFILLSACSGSNREAFAHITQRRLIEGGKVMISYQFRNGSEIVSDSMEVQRAVVVPHDSVKVVFSPENPAKSHLLLP